MARLYHRAEPHSGGGQKVLLATPAYQGLGAGYTFSMFHSVKALEKAGIDCELAIFAEDCHVDDARNRLVRDFLNGDCTDLIFIDSDIRWEADDLVKLSQYDADVVGATYKFRQEVEDGMPIWFFEDVTPREDGLIKVRGLPTGFLRIKRHVLAKLAIDSVKVTPKSDSLGDVPIIFERTVSNNQRVGGDYTFCQKFQAHGGTVLCDPEIVLAHAGSHIFTGSLGSFLRKKNNQTLPVCLQKIKEGKETSETYTEIYDWYDDEWAGSASLMMCAVEMARKADGMILEMGCGITTLCMAAANPDQMIFCMEHDEEQAQRFYAMARSSGLNTKNIVVVQTEIKDGFYDMQEITEHLAEFYSGKEFSFALHDGPPRQISDRMKFFDVVDFDIKTILVDDINDTPYREKLQKWSDENDWEFTVIDRRTGIMQREPELAHHSV